MYKTSDGVENCAENQTVNCKTLNANCERYTGFFKIKIGWLESARSAAFNSIFIFRICGWNDFVVHGVRGADVETTSTWSLKTTDVFTFLSVGYAEPSLA